ncbi:MAG: outer membrane protein assembly factor BamA [Rhodobacterales bacterium]|nr:outer membrane protein assembly factor BamA [Rhodobacterales bacterium]
MPDMARAQTYRFSTVQIDGNQRIETSTILNYAGISKGEAISAGALNDAYQRILGSGLFETVTIEPRGRKLVIKVVEFPTINLISFEGNKRIKDEQLQGFIESESRHVFSPTVAERDASTIAEAYSANGRIAARVTPRIIRRNDNRVDLVFEIFEGGNTEVERIGFVGNSAFSDRRLRRVLQSKQAGLLRALFKKDTFVADRVEFDKQVLRDFYLSRGYVDFRTTNVNAELARERDGYFVTFNVQEGQQFKFGEITTVSDIAEADADEFQQAVKVRSGGIYSPALVENSIARLERLAIKKGLRFVRVEPRITRNDRDLTLDIEFALVKGPRIFVERIDIEGNATTLDRVVRGQFRIVEGDPFNPREIRESAERIRALGFFSKADVNAREGSTPDLVVIDVNVEEKTTGSLSFGGTYGTTDGFGIAVKFSEANFLGRGQTINLTVSGASESREYAFGFTEPAFLGRDLSFNLDLAYRETTNLNALYDTDRGSLSTGLTFPVSDNGRFSVHYGLNATNISNYSGAGLLIPAEQAQGRLYASALGYTYSFDSRLTGLNRKAGVLLQFGQDFGGVGGDTSYIKTTAKAVAQTKIFNDEVTLRASLEGGAYSFRTGTSRVTDRFFLGANVMRGFLPDGIGPREYNAGSGANDALGGNSYAVARFEAEFPLGIPEEYGIRGGVFYDIGSVWGLDNTNADTIYNNATARHVIGLSLFWKTPVGPLRFNWTKALSKEAFDTEQTFNLTLSTEF